MVTGSSSVKSIEPLLIRVSIFNGLRFVSKHITRAGLPSYTNDVTVNVDEVLFVITKSRIPL